jgi:Histidine kinase-, DNA gyrase B-, and HSP90-like ATPase
VRAPHRPDPPPGNAEHRPSQGATRYAEARGIKFPPGSAMSGAPVTTRNGGQQGEPTPRNVTPLSAAERKRRQRERARRSDLLYSRDDWQLFLDTATLPQKAGVQPGDLPTLILKELVDNALDAGASDVTLSKVWRRSVLEYVIADDGPGIAPAIVPELFSVNRPLLSSKLRRLPLRGMLGNGLRVVAGAVAASQGSLVVETRGHRLALHIDDATGFTTISADESIPLLPGTVVHVALGNELRFRGDERSFIEPAISIARLGKFYDGPSSSHWYSDQALYRLFQSVALKAATVHAVVAHLGFVLDDDRPARDLTRADAAEVLAQLQRAMPPVAPEALGYVGPDAFGGSYAIKTGLAAIGGAHIPFVIEAWVECSRSDSRGQGEAAIKLWLNRSPNFAEIASAVYGGALVLKGCGIHQCIEGLGAGNYRITLSVITPFIELAGDGKTPALSPVHRMITEVVGKAGKVAHRAMARPPTAMSIKESAWAAMEAAYAKASDDGALPANARQVMYAARPAILAATGKDRLDDKYFTQILLPDFVEANPDTCRDWDICFDARGGFAEPHTGRTVALGTLDVRQYLGDRPPLGSPAVQIEHNDQFPTRGPENRFQTVLFIEKEGFDHLLSAARLPERFDVAVMSTKGMSTTAARLLLDRISTKIEKILVLHDFDVAGFSIFGTLGTDSRRYQFGNSVPIVDIGLRLVDVKTMILQSEPVEVKDWSKRCATLARHGATSDEIAFLRDRRVELNAMTSRQFIDLIEAKLTMHGVAKVVPDAGTIEEHARRLIARRLAREALDEIRDRITMEASAAALPERIEVQLRSYLARHPTLAWDDALAQIIRGKNGRDVVV